MTPVRNVSRSAAPRRWHPWRRARQCAGGAGLMLVGACASTPDPLAEAPAGPSLAAVRAAPADYPDARVRWGGTIATLENGPDETRVFVVARELHSSGRPRLSDRSDGRFVAVLAGFHDPVVYARGREFTVTGTLRETTIAKVGDFDYLYPVVDVDIHRLWPARKPAPEHPPARPFHYYDPWYPYPYPYPYFRPRRKR